MLSSINSVRPYSVNNYAKAQNSAKSQPAFGSAISEVAENGVGKCNKIKQLFENVGFNLAANVGILGLVTPIILKTSAGDPKVILEGLALVKGLIIDPAEAFAVTAIQGHIDIDKASKKQVQLSIRHQPLNPLAYIASFFRSVADNLKKDLDEVP